MIILKIGYYSSFASDILLYATYLVKPQVTIAGFASFALPDSIGRKRCVLTGLFRVRTGQGSPTFW